MPGSLERLQVLLLHCLLEDAGVLVAEVAFGTAWAASFTLA